jgi:ADP-ribosylglycohydrolase
MLLRIAQADAYAMSCEYIKHPRDDSVLEDALKFERYVKHPTHSIRAGSYTDDTQLSIAVARVLLGEGEYTREDFAKSFVSVFCDDPRQGYSRGFQTILEQCRLAQSPYDGFIRLVKPNSFKNGACMRAVPIGVIKDISKLLSTARAQAIVTHNSTHGLWSSQVIALMSHYALYRPEPLSNIGNFLLKWLPNTAIIEHITNCCDRAVVPVDHYNDWLMDGKPWNGRVDSSTNSPDGIGGIALNTVKACYNLIINSNSLIEIMDTLLRWGGDCDSVAAIAWGIASARFNDELPDFWEYGLEPGSKYGPAFLMNLGSELMRKYE